MAETFDIQGLDSNSVKNAPRPFGGARDGLALYEIIYDAGGQPSDYRVLAVNTAFEHMTGLQAQAIVGRTISEIMPGLTEHWTSTFRAVAMSGTPAFLEGAYTHRPSNYLEACAFRSGPGQLICVFRDIGGRKRSEETLRQSEEKYRKIYESSIVGIFQSVPAGRFIDVNPAFAGMLGYESPEDLLSSINDIATQYYVDPEDRRRYRQLVEQNGFVEGIEYKVKGKDGSHVWVNNSSRAHVDENGEVVFYEGIVVNITPRKMAEAALRESQTLWSYAGQLAHIGGWRVNLSENRVKWSDEVAAIHEMPHGYSPTLEEAVAFYAPGYREKISEVFTACIREGTAYDEEMQIVTAKGQRVWIRTIGVAQRDEAGKIVAAVGALQDISERKRSEEALRQLNEVLEQRNQIAEARAGQLQKLTVELIEAEERERSKFAHLLHDDLQQILAAAKMQLQALTERVPGESTLAHATELLDTSINKSRRLSHELSPAVLHQSGLSAGLRWLARQMDEQFGMKVDLKINTDYKVDDSPLKVFVFRAVQEFLFNIVKHAGDKNACVVLSETGGELTLTVSDQGCGFDPRMLERTANTGFGLMTIRERSSHIGGHLTIESAPGQGSRFTLVVPVSRHFREPRTSISMRKTDRLQPADGKRSSGVAGDVRVLFVDDHKVMRQGLIQLIGNQPDIEVVGEAADGEEAVAKAGQLRPNVIVMDVSMPVMDGIEATRRIKALMPEVSIIGLSMHEDEDISRSMRNAGAAAFMRKTASTAELLKAIYEAGGKV
jgi:PAS domain S-box-containing protein